MTGSPGGRTIINTVLNVVVNVVDYEMPIQQAVDAPRLHHQWFPDEVKFEGVKQHADTVKALQGDGPSRQLRKARRRAFDLDQSEDRRLRRRRGQAFERASVRLLTMWHDAPRRVRSGGFQPPTRSTRRLESAATRPSCQFISGAAV